MIVTTTGLMGVVGSGIVTTRA